MILVDANVLLRAIHLDHPHQAVAIEALRELHARGEALVTCAQALRETYVVCTRPVDVGGFGLTPDGALAQLTRIARQMPAQYDPPGTLARWQELLHDYQVRGKQAHDAYYVALMRAGGITMLLTFNDSDFARYAAVTAMNPFDVVGRARS
jgi:predicted nucleic acid-binding protein